MPVTRVFPDYMTNEKGQSEATLRSFLWFFWGVLVSGVYGLRVVVRRPISY